MIGNQHIILITGASKKNPDEMTGRTECNRIVNFKLPENFNATTQSAVGTLLPVKITEIRTNSLRAVIE
jgi:tRNA-2-methylthio-N6-dimethylallyladenosine synthase